MRFVKLSGMWTNLEVYQTHIVSIEEESRSVYVLNQLEIYVDCQFMVLMIVINWSALEFKVDNLKDKQEMLLFIRP